MLNSCRLDCETQSQSFLDNYNISAVFLFSSLWMFAVVTDVSIVTTSSLNTSLSTN